MTVVSALIPVYNGESFVGAAIRSALNQRGVSVEVVVIDDGSTDGTAEVLRSFGSSIRVLRQPNAGHVRARNNGARLARGEWLAFLDADDEWLPEKLERQLARARPEVGMVYTDRHNVGEIGRIREFASESTPLWEGDIFEALLFGNFVTVSSVIMRCDWFERLGGFDPDPFGCEDWDLWLRFAAAGGIAAAEAAPLTRYRWHAASMTFSADRMNMGRLMSVQRALASDRGRRLQPQVARRALAATWKTSAWYAMPQHRRHAAAWYLRSCLYWPWDASVYKGLVKCVLGRA